MRIKKEQAKEFLNKINPKDKIVIVHHFDFDGFASAILIYDYLVSKNCNDIRVFGIKLKMNALDGIIEDLKLCDKVIVADLGDDLICDNLNELGDKDILILDHHPKCSKFFEKILEYNDFDEGYFPSSRTCYEIVGGKKWLSVAGVISDKGYLYKENENFINGFLKEENLSLEDCKTFVDYVDYALIFLKDNSQKAFNLLKDFSSFDDVKILKDYYFPIKTEIDFFVDDFEKNKEKLGNVYFYYFEPKFKIKTILVNIFSLKYPKNILIFVSPSGNGNYVSLSVRYQDGKINVAEFLKNCMNNLKDSHAGGHQRASGGIIQKEDLEKFKENILNE